MKLTEALKGWIVANCGVAADATDEDYRKAAADAMLKGSGESGYLSHEQYVELTASPVGKQASALESKLSLASSALRTGPGRLK